MNAYNLKNLKEELKTATYRAEHEKKADKIFYINDLKYCYKALKVGQKSELLTVADYLTSRLQTPEKIKGKYIDLKNFGDYSRTAYEYTDENEIYITYPTAEEEKAIKETIKEVEEFSKKNRRNFYYMDEYERLETYCYNYISYFRRELTPETRTETNLTLFRYCNLIAPYENERAKKTEEKHAEYLKAGQSFINSFVLIFEQCLNFNIEILNNYGKLGDCNEQLARLIIEKVGGYNNFNISQFDKILHYLNDNFLKYYNEGNPNNNSRNFTVSFGRESSPVLYIRIYTDNENSARKILNDFEHITNANEVTIATISPAWKGISATFRLWWD